MRILFLTALLFFTCSTAFSQTFMHGAGLNVFVVAVPGNDAEVGEGFNYFPRFNLSESESSSFSIGIPLTVGFSFSGSYYSGDYYADETSASFSVNAPVILNLNLGRGSTKENTDKMGYFFGAGFGYHHGQFYHSDEYFEPYTRTVNTYGPAGNAGVRIGVGRYHKNIEIRLSYMKGVNDVKPAVFGLGGSFNF